MYGNFQTYSNVFVKKHLFLCNSVPIYLEGLQLSGVIRPQDLKVRGCPLTIGVCVGLISNSC